ncbi:MAG: peptide chain release factor N(5)-glutamine methyltransferase [Candidatus Omnitrophota bacterium]
MTVMPEQYLTGKAYFMDFEIRVNRHTFIPRPETEILVEKTLEAMNIIRARNPGAACLRVLDVGTGSGNISISLTKYDEQCKITALDISENAVVKAKQNADEAGVSDRLCLAVSDYFDSLIPAKYFDIIVSNPPYISGPDMETLPDMVRLEPGIALYGGCDGLDAYRAIIHGAPLYTKNGGYLIMEVGYDQARRVSGIMADAEYGRVEIFRDYSGIERIVRGVNG